MQPAEVVLVSALRRIPEVRGVDAIQINERRSVVIGHSRDCFFAMFVRPVPRRFRRLFRRLGYVTLTADLEAIRSDPDAAAKKLLERGFSVCGNEKRKRSDSIQTQTSSSGDDVLERRSGR